VRGIAFREVMEGAFTRDGTSHPFRLSLRVSGPSILLFPFGWTGDAEGRVHIGGFVEDAETRGTIEISTLVKRRIRYAFDFAGQTGERLRFDGLKKIRFLFFGWTRLRGAIYDVSGTVLGQAQLRFSYRKHFIPFVSSFRAIRRPARAES
jgi:hypothetical protein